MMDEVLAKGRTWIIEQGDCREVLKRLPDDSVDAVVTDPPAGIEFMGKEWDSFEERAPNPSGPQTEAWHGNNGKNPYARSATPRYRGKTNQSLLPFQDFIAEVFTEVYRVMKPGAHAIVWALPRTSHHTMMGLERAGFDVRDIVCHVFGQGFPKSMDISKAIDKAAGAEREVVGYDAARARPNRKYKSGALGNVGGHENVSDRTDNGATLTAPATEAAQKWNGWGTALKPSTEFWILCRKPLSESSVAANVLKHGTGGINIDGSRIHSGPSEGGALSGQTALDHYEGGWNPRQNRPTIDRSMAAGRWPANLVLSHSSGCVLKGTKMVHAPVINQWVDGAKPFGGGAGHPYQTVKTGDENGMEEVEDWACVDGCPVRELDLQSGELTSGKEPEGGFIRHAPDVREGIYGGGKGLWKDEQVAGSLFGDTGGASRFFKTFGPLPDSPFGYFPKASRGEREVGLDSLKKGHTLGPMAGRGQPGLKCRTCGKWKASGSPCKCAKPDWEQVPFDRPDVANTHPTVKSVDLMSWLCKMVTPPDGVVLDPFTGSGSTGIAALKQGFRFIGIEQNEEYTEIAKKRIEGDSPLFNMA